MDIRRLIGITMPVIIFLIWQGLLYLLLAYYRMGKKGHRNPLTRQLLRSPGESLRSQIEDINLDVISYGMIFMTFPLLMYAILESEALNPHATDDISSYFIALITCCLELFAGYKLLRLLKIRNNLRLGFDCEVAVGQELNLLMREGCYVYHDFPADKFNIDHVVVSPKGVLAVETKGRKKRDNKGGAEEATVVYDSGALKFPGWTEKEPIDQAKRQADWLAKWLSSAVGEKVSAQAVLALPGWYVDRKESSPGVLFFNGKNSDLLLKLVQGDQLSDVLMKRISHQLEQRCRDIEPTAYSKTTKDK